MSALRGNTNLTNDDNMLDRFRSPSATQIYSSARKLLKVPNDDIDQLKITRNDQDENMDMQNDGKKDKTHIAKRHKKIANMPKRVRSKSSEITLDGGTDALHVALLERSKTDMLTQNNLSPIEIERGKSDSFFQTYPGNHDTTATLNVSDGIHPISRIQNNTPLWSLPQSNQIAQIDKLIKSTSLTNNMQENTNVITSDLTQISDTTPHNKHGTNPYATPSTIHGATNMTDSSSILAKKYPDNSSVSGSSSNILNKLTNSPGGVSSTSTTNMPMNVRNGHRANNGRNLILPLPLSNSNNSNVANADLSNIINANATYEDIVNVNEYIHQAFPKVHCISENIESSTDLSSSSHNGHAFAIMSNPVPVEPLQSSDSVRKNKSRRQQLKEKKKAQNAMSQSLNSTASNTASAGLASMLSISALTINSTPPRKTKSNLDQSPIGNLSSPPPLLTTTPSVVSPPTIHMIENCANTSNSGLIEPIQKPHNSGQTLNKFKSLDSTPTKLNNNSNNNNNNDNSSSNNNNVGTSSATKEHVTKKDVTTVHPPNTSAENGMSKAQINDRILREKLHEAKALSLKSVGSDGAVMHQFSLWTKISQKTASDNTGVNNESTTERLVSSSSPFQLLNAESVDNDVLNVAAPKRSGRLRGPRAAVRQMKFEEAIEAVSLDNPADKSQTNIREAKLDTYSEISHSRGRNTSSIVVPPLPLHSLPGTQDSNSHKYNIPTSSEDDRNMHSDEDSDSVMEEKQVGSMANAFRSMVGSCKLNQPSVGSMDSIKTDRTAAALRYSPQGSDNSEVCKNEVDDDDESLSDIESVSERDPREVDTSHVESVDSEQPYKHYAQVSPDIASNDVKEEDFFQNNLENSLSFSQTQLTSLSQTGDPFREELSPVFSHLRNKSNVRVQDTPNHRHQISSVDSAPYDKQNRTALSESPTLSEVSDGEMIGSAKMSNMASTNDRPSNASDVTLNGSVVHQNQSISWKQSQEVLGEGTFGKVFKGMNESTGELLAIKLICLNEGTKEEVNVLRKEIEVMQHLIHPNIVRYIGTSVTERYLFIIIEYVPGGSVAGMLSQFGACSDALIKRLVKQMLQGVDYLHSRMIVHRDIKGANVLVTDSGVAKLADFGCSKQLAGMCTVSLEDSMKIIRGSVPWMAPEVIKQAGHGRSADIWSVGATMIEMATAKHPWPEFTNNVAALFHVATAKEPPPIPSNMSAGAAKLLRRCTVIDPKGRATALELLDDPYLA